MSWKLDKNSTMVGQPEKLKINLKKHQLSMLHKCEEIEKSGNKHGFMGDKAGCGKTAVILSLILNDKIKNGSSINIVIVPQNIIQQWVDETKKFCGEELSIIKFTEYSDIISLYQFKPKILQGYNIMITTPLYYETIMSSLKINNIGVRRIIYDEVDTIESTVKNLDVKENFKYNVSTKFYKEASIVERPKEAGINNKISWFVSASLHTLLDNNGFKLGNLFVETSKLGNFFVKCDDKYIDDCQETLVQPVFKIIEANSILDKFSTYLSITHKDYLNSMSFNFISSKNGGEQGTDIKSSLKIIMNGYLLNILQNKEIIKISDEDIPEELQKNIKTAKGEYDFNKKLLDIIHSSTNCDKECSEYAGIVKCVNAYISAFNNENTKEDELDKFFKNTPKRKILIFSDFTGGFNIVNNILDKYSIKYSELSKGNPVEINECINGYKNGDISVLLIDSSSSGAGMNLENTDDILFLHRTSQSLRSQIIGRAQRPGRKTVLNVYNLYNKNENI